MSALAYAHNVLSVLLNALYAPQMSRTFFGENNIQILANSGQAVLNCTFCIVFITNLT